MGPVRRRRTPALSIELLDDQTAFLPGDIILGRVVRRTATDNPNADVTVTLCGRTLSRVTVTTRDSGGDSHHTHHSACFPLVDDGARAQRLASGPLHIPDVDGAEAEWPFSIQLPLRVDPAGPAAAAAGDRTFVPAAEVASHPLPCSYASFGYDVEAAVEYWIAATVELVGKRDKPERAEAVLPITVNTVRPGPRLADYGLATSSRRAQVATHRLVPGMAAAGSRLSLSQRAQRLFRSSRVPVFAGAVEFGLPTAVQLEDRSPVPVLVRFVPDPYQGSAEVEGRPQRVKLAKLIMTLRGSTVVRSGSAQATGPESQGRVLLWPPGDKEPAKPFYVPCSDEWPAADVGEHVGLRLGRKGVIGMSNLCPTFTTYLIQRVYEIEFEVHLDIAGEITKHKFESDLEVAAPFDTRPYPPTDESMPPPSFDEALRSPNLGGQGQHFGSMARSGAYTGLDMASGIINVIAEGARD
ncbi:hypothetical protein RB600_004944 [Gaeumannomyces tritici]